jgi:hypothetical protein
MDEPAPTSSFAALGQGTWWVDVEDRPHRLAEMTDEYLSNVIGHLLVHADTYRTWWQVGVTHDDTATVAEGRWAAELVARSAGAPAPWEITSAAWLEAAPLVRALRAELRRRHPEHPAGRG